MIEIGPFRQEELPTVADKILDSSGSRVFAFYGEMGHGKTTLIKALCERLGVEDATSSPTFSIVNEYVDATGESIFHFDFYRIESLKEAIEIGTEEYLYSGDYCFLEWPEKVLELIPEDHLQINIILVDEITRIVRLNQPE